MNDVADIAHGLRIGRRYVARIGRFTCTAGRYWSGRAGVFYYIQFIDAPHLAHLNERHFDPWEAARSMTGIAIWSEDRAENRTFRV